jgi:hypothetical protein
MAAVNGEAIYALSLNKRKQEFCNKNHQRKKGCFISAYIIVTL